MKSGTIINDRDSFDLLPHVIQGHLIWAMDEEDNIILADKKDFEEQHRLLLIWTWGGKTGAHEIDFYVTNLQKVTP